MKNFPRLFPVLLAAVVVPVQLHAAALPVEVTSNQLDIQHTKGEAVFAGNVVVTQGNLTLNAPRITVTYGKNGSSDVESMRAQGGVTITRTAEGGAEEKAQGLTATYNPSKQQLVMEGNVQLTRGPSTLSGDKLLYDIASGNARVTTNSGAPVKARFTPQQ